MYSKFESELGGLKDSNNYREPCDIAGLDSDTLKSQIEKMLIIRYAEEAIANLIVSNSAKCPCHLSIGQEAIAVGVAEHLNSDDKVFSGHRSHAHFLSLGVPVEGLISEVLGKESGSSKGMGGSQHLYGAEHGFIGSLPIVGGTIPLAVGAALAAKMDGKGGVAVTYFGDGAAEEGVLHESLNLASKFSLPVLFVCENNLFASHLDIHLRQPSDRISRFAEAHKIPCEVVDGNDVTSVSMAASRMIENLRDGKGPAFLEAVTYRWRGHVGPAEDIDVGLMRKPEDLAAWKKRDPIKRLKEALILTGDMSEADFESLQAKVRKRIDSSVEKAESDEYPDAGALLDRVYSGSSK